MPLDPDSAIAELYAAFSRPTAPIVYGCPCCITPEELAALTATPLRDVSAEVLEPYAFSVMLTVGDSEDLRYFWPRLVELLFRGELLTDQEIVFAAPDRAGWRGWPVGEQRATERFVAAVINDMTTRPYEGRDVDSWVCAFSRLLEDIIPWLQPLLTTTPAAAASLRGFYGVNEDRLRRGRLRNAFWDSFPGKEQKLVEWLRSPDVLDAVTRAYALLDLGMEPLRAPDA